MYNISDTIAAVSSPAGTDAIRHIIRISGPQAFELIAKVFESAGNLTRQGIFRGKINIDNDLSVDTAAYVFQSPHSYTGDDLIELHITGPSLITEAIMNRLLSLGIRAAGPGEFTARAYLNGKMDLAQAEAVAQIVTGSNIMQLNAAQKLLAGRLAGTINEIQDKLLDLISRIEAGLDFSGEDIAFISASEAIEHINIITGTLRQLLEGSISCEETISLPAVGIVGAPNAGKSSLLNALLGKERSIVSGTAATTRDVLTGILKLTHSNCAIFDCAGLLPQTTEKSILEKLAQDAAIEAIHFAELVLFCVDISKSAWTEDAAIFEFIRRKKIIAIATKCDKSNQNDLNLKIDHLQAIFGQKFLSTSSVSGDGLTSLQKEIDTILTQSGTAISQAADIISLNQRHRQRLSEAINNLDNAKREIMSDNEELAAMLLRNAYRAFRELSSEEGVDDAVLDRIFSRFCIGK